MSAALSFEVEIVEADLEAATAELRAALPSVRWTHHAQHRVITGIAGADIVRLTEDRGLWRAEVSGSWWDPSYGEVPLMWLALTLPRIVDVAAALGAVLATRPHIGGI